MGGANRVHAGSAVGIGLAGLAAAALTALWLLVTWGLRPLPDQAAGRKMAD